MSNPNANLTLTLTLNLTLTLALARHEWSGPVHVEAETVLAFCGEELNMLARPVRPQTYPAPSPQPEPQPRARAPAPSPSPGWSFIFGAPFGLTSSWKCDFCSKSLPYSALF